MIKAEPNVRVSVTPAIVTIQVEQPSVRAIVPVTTEDNKTAVNFELQTPQIVFFTNCNFLIIVIFLIRGISTPLINPTKL